MTRKKMDNLLDAEHLEPDASATEEEIALAQVLSSSLDALERGRAGLDLLPNAPPDDLVDLVTFSHLLRASGPAGELSDDRQRDLWGDLDAQLDVLSTAQPIRQRAPWWRWIALGVPTLAAALLAVWWFASPPPPSSTPSPAQPVATAAEAPGAIDGLDALDARFALTLSQRNDATPEPAGDTALRDYRSARFDAWQRDTTWHQRQGLLGTRSEHAARSVEGAEGLARAVLAPSRSLLTAAALGHSALRSRR